MKYAVIAVIVALTLWLVPLTLIWALNTLFGLAIPFTFKTWLASLVLGGLFSPRASQ